MATQQRNISTVGRTAYAASPEALRDEVGNALERLSQLLVAHTSRHVLDSDDVAAAPGVEALQDSVRFLGQVIAAWSDIPDGALPAVGAGFGSTVFVEDLDQGVRETFTLMAGALLDIDAGQVSLASPIGQALLGAKKGAVVSVQTPQRIRRFRVSSVITLSDRIAQHSTLPAA